MICVAPTATWPPAGCSTIGGGVGVGEIPGEGDADAPGDPAGVTDAPGDGAGVTGGLICWARGTANVSSTHPAASASVYERSVTRS